MTFSAALSITALSTVVATPAAHVQYLYVIYGSYTANDYIRNQSGTRNSAPRQFNFVAPVVVPEVGTFALLLPAFALSGSIVARRRVGVTTH